MCPYGLEAPGERLLSIDTDQTEDGRPPGTPFPFDSSWANPLELVQAELPSLARSKGCRVW